jgi:hypothetical protein
MKQVANLMNSKFSAKYKFLIDLECFEVIFLSKGIGGCGRLRFG